jgi:hypothetical protein
MLTITQRTGLPRALPKPVPGTTFTKQWRGEPCNAWLLDRLRAGAWAEPVLTTKGWCNSDDVLDEDQQATTDDELLDELVDQMDDPIAAELEYTKPSRRRPYME